MPQVPPSGDTGTPRKKKHPEHVDLPKPPGGGNGGGGGGGGGGGAALAKRLLDYAVSFIGTPYVWGGSSPGGFDCSGLIQYTFAHFGIHLPRIADAQARVGTAVNGRNARPGDLVYFENNANEPGFDHIGIYLGNGMMLAAPHTGAQVRIQPVGNATGFTRILGNQAYQGMASSQQGQYVYRPPAGVHVGSAPMTHSGDALTAPGAGAEKNALNSPGIVSQFGYLAAYLNDPVLGGILRDYAQNHKGNTGWLLSQLEKTDWWKHHSQTARELGALQKTDPASFRQQWNQQRQTIAQEASQMGVRIAPNRLNQLTTTSMFSGWDAGQITQAVGAEFHYNPDAKYTGTAGNTVQKLKALSGQYLVPMGDGALQSWTRQVLEGKKNSPDDYTNYLAQQAKSLFPWMSKAIDKGMTPTDYLQPYQQAAAQTLEIDPSSIDLSNHKWRNLFETVDPKTGDRSERGLANAMTLMRTDPRYNYDSTQGAKQEAASLAQTIAQSFGFAA